MKLYIQVKDGNPIKHPAFEENLLQAFGSIPDDWEPFVRKEKPRLAFYQFIEQTTSTYAKVDGVWTDIWIIKEIPEDEKISLQNEVKNAWETRPYADNFTAWVYNERANVFEPPFPRPSDAPEGFLYRWNGKEDNWKLAPVFPDDGKNYTFDFDNWVNVEE